MLWKNILKKIIDYKGQNFGVSSFLSFYHFHMIKCSYNHGESRFNE